MFSLTLVKTEGEKKREDALARTVIAGECSLNWKEPMKGGAKVINAYRSRARQDSLLGRR